MERTPNARQTAVINELDNNLIVFASAGTGKTYTVSNRVRAILERTDTMPEEILCLTFTVKACDELREDIENYVDAAAKRIHVQTIHSFCLSLLREEERLDGGKRACVGVCDDTDEEELLKRIFTDRYGVWTENEGDGVRLFRIFSKRDALRNLVSELKHRRFEGGFYSGNEEEDYQKAFAYLKKTDPRKYTEAFSYYERFVGLAKDMSFELAVTACVGKWVSEYDERLRQSNLVDFDDLVLLAARYLKDSSVRARWEKRFKYIIVDEMQDTSVLEYEVLKQIFGKNNIMLCGDFFQTIYEWRSARPQQVLGAFIQDFAPRRYAFTENYRATQTLANASFSYLENAYPALIGEYLPNAIEVKSVDTGEKIRCVALENFEQEAAAIYDYARRNPPKTANELCVVVRSNKYVAELSSVFEKLNNERKDGGRVEFFTAESHMRFYKKPVVKDALAVIKLALDGADEVSMERLSERFVARVGLKTLESLRKTLPCGLGVAAFSDFRAYRDGDEYAALLSALEGGRVVVYDTETTGLDLARDEAIQLAAIKIDANGNTIEHFERMIFPTVPIGRGAYETHGFDEAYIASHGGVTAKEAYASFSEFVRGCVLVGHNSARFDSPLVKRQLRDLGLPPLEIDEEYDTLILSRRIHSELPDHKLATLCARYGVVNEAAHDASGDIAATAKVLVGMVDSVLAPRTNERRQAFEEYREKFEKFFGFLQEVRGCIRENRLAEIMPLIVEKMHLESKYPEERGAINRLCAVFEGECTDDCEQFLRLYLTEISLYASRADALLGKNGALPIITVHQAKGCEFDTVIVAGADNRNFPSFMSRGTPDEDGEKKIFYVAITRAKKRLILTRPLYNGRYEVSPSPFVAKIPEKYLSKSERW